VWETKGKLKEGMSGSPIFTYSGKVFALLLGILKRDGKEFAVT
jgi:hypothetical protein